MISLPSIAVRHREQGLLGLLRRGASKFFIEPLTSLCYRFRYRAISDPAKVIIVDPTEICFYRDRPPRGSSTAKMRSAAQRFNIQGGDWDRKLHRVTDHFRYQGLVERFVHGMSWHETVIFQKEVVEKRKIQDFAAKVATFNEKCARRDALCESIKRHGVLPSSKLSEDFREAFDQGSRRNVVVNIGREGMLIFTRKGWHRLCMAKILGVRNLPVEVDVRHLKWQAIREEIHRSRSYGALSKRARAHLAHPDLADLVPPCWLTEGQKSEAMNPNSKVGRVNAAPLRT